MKTAAETIMAYRPPPQSRGRGDKYLADAAQELARLMRKAQHRFSVTGCRLPEQAWGEISPIVVEWAEDIHNDLGLWRAIETCQQQWFGTPLPLILTPPFAGTLQGFDPQRIRFLLWNLWFYFNPNVVLSPADPDLANLAELSASFLNERFARLPKDSGIAHLLAQPNEHAWDLKRKLLWLGRSSYLFRWSFFAYLDKHNAERDVMRTDEFVCRHCTHWSGLGVVDVLGAAVTLTDAERAELQRWPERHMSMYRMVDMENVGGYVRRVFARNVVNGESYTIRVEQDLGQCRLLPGTVAFGWLAPWHGEWYWSGQQHFHGELPESEDARLRKEVVTELGNLVYRYCPAELAKAREVSGQQHEEFTAIYGSDLAIFPDAAAAEAAEQKRLDRWRNAHTELFGLPPGESRPLSFPRVFLEGSQGVGAFSSPETGVEYLRDINLVQSGLAKRGAGLTNEEAKALRGLMTVQAISPEGVRRVVGEQGYASITEAFAIRDYPLDTAIQFLLRRHKGWDYRARYPTISL